MFDQGSNSVLQNSIQINDGNRDDTVLAIELGQIGVRKDTFVGHRLGKQLTIAPWPSNYQGVLSWQDMRFW